MGNKLCATWHKGYHEAGLPWPPRKETQRIRLWAEIFEVREENGQMFWGRVSDDLVPVNIVCIQDTPTTLYQITAYNSLVKKIFDIRLVQPGTLLVQPSDCFIHWRDVETGHEWGLNFTVPSDAKQFRDCCMSRVPQGLSRKASSSESLRPKSRKQQISGVKVASNTSSPQHAQSAVMSASLQDGGNDVSHYGYGTPADARHYSTTSSQRHCADCSRHCCVKQQVQLVSVYVNNWCGADADQPADSSFSDYNTLPHYQRYQRCLQHQQLQQQQQPCMSSHYGQRAQLMYEAVGRSRDTADCGRAMTLCSRHGRSQSLSPGRARYAATRQLCYSARTRRPLLPSAEPQMIAPASDRAADAAEARSPEPGSDVWNEEATSTVATERDSAEQKVLSTVEEASAPTVSGAVSNNDAVRTADDDAMMECTASTAERTDDVDSSPAHIPVLDKPDRSEKHTVQSAADGDRTMNTVTDLLTDCREEVVAEKPAADETVDECESAKSTEVATVNGHVDIELSPEVKHESSELGEQVTDECNAAESIDGDQRSLSASRVISMDSSKFDSSALEKLLSSLSASSMSASSSRQEQSRPSEYDCSNDDDDDDDLEVEDEVWMRRDVDAGCQSSLAMLDAAAAQLDDDRLNFKSTRSSSASSSPSVGHCSPSCLIPQSTVDAADTHNSTSFVFACDAQVKALNAALPTSTDDILTSSADVEPAPMDGNSQLPGLH